MFTGIVEATGVVRDVRTGRESVRLRIEAGCDIRDTRVGDSIAVSGVCLTVTEIAGATFEADLTPETLTRTTLGELRPGDSVNLERPVAVGDRLGGHVVQGHVDAVGRVVRRDPHGDAWWLEVAFPQSMARYIVEKGSVAVDGVSLTVAQCVGTRFTACLIPHTVEVTTLGRVAAGAGVNLEVDILAKYIERLLGAYTQVGLGGSATGAPEGAAPPGGRSEQARRAGTER
jgi:riboflavin synthase